MAFDEPLHGMHDPRLKPRLLSSIMATHLPDDRQPPKSPAELSLAVSMIRTHHLLFEPSVNEPPPNAARTVDGYKVAVDAWVERVVILLSSTSTEKSWAGVCLLGVTCKECSRQRFLESYLSWFQKLVLHLKATDPLFVRGAACASLTDLLIRLGTLDHPGVRREGNSLSAKLAQPILQLLAEEGSKSVWNDGVDLLCAILKFFPASLKQQTSQVEALLVAKLMEVEMNTSLSEKFAHCLAFLPKAQGDSATWNSLLRRILLAINSYLDDAFMGMEDGSLGNDVVSALIPRGQEQNWFLGGVSVVTSATSKKFWQVLVPRISLLMKCCRYLLLNGYPVQVPVPLTALLALVTRILSMHGSAYQATSMVRMPVSSSQQTTLCCELPALHFCALDLLQAIISGVRSQLLPRGAEIVRLLSEYFQRCGLPNLRIKLYIISKYLIISMGVGLASTFAPVLLDNALADIKGALSGCSLNASGVNHPANPRKRKDPNSLQIEMPSTMATTDVGLDSHDAVSNLVIQTAALEAIEALLTVGGSLRSENWRAEVDSIIANVAMIASSGVLSNTLMVENTSPRGDTYTLSLESFQLAAYKALLASILSPCTHRPPFLSQGLMIFRRGRQEAAGTNLAEFCAHALLTLDPLIHPRSLPSVSAPLLGTNATHRRISTIQNLSRANIDLQPMMGDENMGSAIDHAYSQQLAPSSVTSVKMSNEIIEVEGDPYVQEDIESWIIDYGGEQNFLIKTTNSMLATFQGELQQAMDGTPETMEVVNVRARQSLANDEDGMTGSMHPESHEASGVHNHLDMTRAKLQADNVAETSGLLMREMGNTGMLHQESCNQLPALGPGPSGVSKTVVATGWEKQDGTLLDSVSEMGFASTVCSSGILQPPKDLVTEAPKVLPQMDLLDSDSDAIPDIVDGDPDSD